MGIIWRLLLFLMLILLAWRKFAPKSWQAQYVAVQRLAWLIVVVFAMAVIWRFLGLA